MFVPHDVPFALFPFSVQTGVPVVQATAPVPPPAPPRPPGMDPAVEPPTAPTPPVPPPLPPVATLPPLPPVATAPPVPAAPSGDSGSTRRPQPSPVHPTTSHTSATRLN